MTLNCTQAQIPCLTTEVPGTNSLAKQGFKCEEGEGRKRERKDGKKEVPLKICSYR